MKLIKINEEHYVVVDDSEIKEGDWCLMFDDYGNLFLGNQPQQYLGEQAGHHLNKGLKKITHSTIPKGMMLMEGIERLSLQEVKELIGEVDVENEYVEKDLWWAYVRGFQANEEKKNPLEDFKDVIKSLKPKTEWEVEIVDNIIWKK